MADSNPILKSIRKSAGFRIAILFGTFFIFLLLSSIISMKIEMFPGDKRTQLLISSAIQCVLAFCIPAFVLARFSSNNSIGWLHLTKAPPLKAIAGVILVYIVSMPAMEWLIEWNAGLHLPESLSSLEQQFRRWEESGEATTGIILDTHGWLSVIAGILVIGVLTGLSEELFFRGGLQGIFSRTSIGKGTAVWVAGFIFSFMHFQFFGFVPRFKMGAFFGYLLVWTGSLWVPVFAHVLNNSMVVIAASLTGDANASLLQQQQIMEPGSSYVVIGSALLTAIILLLWRDNIFRSSQKKRKTQYSTWQRKRQTSVSER